MFWNIFASIVNIVSGLMSLFKGKSAEEKLSDMKVEKEKISTQSVKKYHEEKDKIAKAQVELSESNHISDNEIKELRITKKLRIDL